MADHSELVSEMALLEKMSTQDRLKLARKRRLQQLKKWNQKEKEFLSNQSKNKHTKKQDILSSRAFKSASASFTSSASPSAMNTSSTTTTSSSSSNSVTGIMSRKHLLGHHHNQQHKSPNGQSYKVHFVPSVMLLEAAARSDIDEVRRLLLLSVSPDSANEDGLTALHQCCIDDSEDMMRLLIEFGADVNARDTEQWTPLHAAATCGHLHLVKQLIARGADLLAVNADGNMPYDICEDEATLDFIESEMAKRGITQELIDETRSKTEVQMLEDLKRLAEQKGDLEYRNASDGSTPLHVASANGYVSVVEFLLDHHVATDVLDKDSWQPVHAAACWGHADVLELLVQAGADLSARTKNGETPVDICEDPELRERILQLEKEIESKRGSSSYRLKRTPSSNTRSQSIRRTSIREKNQTSRREAREEGRLLRQTDVLSVVPVDPDEDLVPQPEVLDLTTDGLLHVDSGSETTDTHVMNKDNNKNYISQQQQNSDSSKRDILSNEPEAKEGKNSRTRGKDPPANLSSSSSQPSPQQQQQHQVLVVVSNVTNISCHQLPNGTSSLTLSPVGQDQLSYKKSESLADDEDVFSPSSIASIHSLNQSHSDKNSKSRAVDEFSSRIIPTSSTNTTSHNHHHHPHPSDHQTGNREGNQLQSLQASASPSSASPASHAHASSSPFQSLPQSAPHSMSPQLQPLSLPSQSSVQATTRPAPGSPTSLRMKFCSDPSEVVGGTSRKRGCCTIS